MIGGNMTASLQVRTIGTDAIGEQTEQWETAQTVTGWLDYLTGNSNRDCNTKLQESTHVFVMDYADIVDGIKPETARFIDSNGAVYEILVIDDPMYLHSQIEIYLKYVGGQ